jgi:hypothetical protein
VGPAGTVVEALLANDRGGLKFSCRQYLGGRKIPPAPDSSAVWSPVATERSSCIRKLSYRVFCFYGNSQNSWL